MYDNLFEPIQVGRVTIPNRIVRAPHGTLLEGDELIGYHEARAKGGVGMSTLEATSVHTSAPGRLPLWSDDCIPFYEKLTSTIRPYGMKLFQQLYHAGAGYPEAVGMPEHWSASAIPNPMAGVVPVEMTKTMIDDVVASFATAAGRCRDGGLEGVDIHASSGYLILDMSHVGREIRVGEELAFTLSYSALLRAMTSEYVAKELVGGV